jgi:ubiquinone/menaquinone biosynthesis C-methylase UbiE
MKKEYLATGFTDVDGRQDIASYTNCLSLLDSLPYFRWYKQRSYDLVRLSPGLSVLEVGCGIGDDVLRMAARVMPTGTVIGVDASFHMIQQTLCREDMPTGVTFAQADARCLPFKENSFARCRIDRTLQHIREPQQAIQEMVRVLKPDGILLAYDNDWGTFSISGRNDETTRTIETLWMDAFTNRWIGRYLKRFFLEAGLQKVMVEPSVSVISDFETADRVYNIRQTVERAVAAACIDPEDAEAWLSDVRKQSPSGFFLCSLTAFTVTGVKPS